MVGQHRVEAAKTFSVPRVGSRSRRRTRREVRTGGYVTSMTKEKQLQALTGISVISANLTTSIESEEDFSVRTPPRRLLSMAVACFKPPPPPPPPWAGRVVAEKELSAERTSGTGESRRTKPVSSGVLRRQARARAARTARPAPSSIVAEEMRVDMGLSPRYTPPMISPVRVDLPLTPVRSAPPWMGKPAARTNRE